MLNEKILGLVKESILSDRNMKAGNISEIKIAKAYIELTIEDNADKIKIKRETKENLKTYWNLTMMNDEDIKQFIETHHITFTEFRTTFEGIIKDIHGNIDLDNCVEEALNDLADQKITSNSSRVQKSHNAGKKAEEIHGKGEEPKEPLELPQPNEPLGIEPPSEPIEPTEPVEAEKVEDEIEDAEIVEDDFKIVRDGEIEGLEDIEIEEEKQEDEGIKAEEEF